MTRTWERIELLLIVITSGLYLVLRNIGQDIIDNPREDDYTAW